VAALGLGIVAFLAIALYGSMMLRAFRHRRRRASANPLSRPALRIVRNDEVDSYVDVASGWYAIGAESASESRVTDIERERPRRSLGG
jgi:hypothetical protein